MKSERRPDSRGRSRPRSRRTLRRSAGLLAVAAALMSGNVAAQDESEVEPPAAPDQVVIFVIDLSGSMNQPFDGDRTKLDVAKDVFAETFTRAAPDALVGLRVFGDQFPAEPPGNREQNCSADTRVISPPAVIDRGPLVEDVRLLEARGDTAIALALRAANDDIPEGSLGTVVLFSDGRDECFDADLDGDAAVGPSYGEDPCVVAGDIAGDGVDLRIDRIDTIGLRTDEAAELELRCIADSTGGSFTPVNTQDDVTAATQVLAETASPRAAERLGGQAIIGSATQDGAPELGRLDSESATGRYTDTIEMNTERWYRFGEYGSGGGSFTATAFGLPAQEGIEFGMRMYLPETDQTFFENRSDSNAGIPLRPTASIRCPGCSVSGAPNEVFWVITLSTENPALGGSYDLEILTEGRAFGGADLSCSEGQECWFEAQIENREAAIAELEEQIANEAPATTAPPEELAPPVTAPDRSAELDALVDDVAALNSSLDTAQSAAETAEAEADAARRRADELQLLSETDGGGSGSVVLPLLLALLGLGAGGAAIALRSKSEPALVVAGAPTQGGIDALGTQPLAPDQRDTLPTRGDAPPTPGPLDSPSDGVVVGSVTGPPVQPPPPVPPSPPAPNADGAVGAPDVVEPAVDAGAAGASGDLFDGAPDALEVPLPGWYEDPDELAMLRWWDGERWTSHTRPDDGGAAQ